MIRNKKGGCEMLVLRKCECGGTRFSKEPDDIELRCEDCGSRARYGYIPDETDDEEDEE